MNKIFKVASLKWEECNISEHITNATTSLKLFIMITYDSFVIICNKCS